MNNCSDCKHEYHNHYTSYGGTMGCGFAVKTKILTYSPVDADWANLKCPCKGYAIIVRRDMLGNALD